MRNLPPDLRALLGENVVRPVILLEIHFSNVLHLCSYSTLEWASVIWQKSDFYIESFTVNKNGVISGAIVFGNTDDLINYYILEEGIAGKDIKIYLSYIDGSGQLATPFLVFDGAGDRSEIRYTRTSIQITNEFMYTSRSPRFRICKENGFNWLPVPGTKIRWKGQTITLDLE